MGSTALFKYRYPEAVDPPDGPLGYRNLAEDVEASLANLAGFAVVSGTGSTTIPPNQDYGPANITVTSSVPGLATGGQDVITFAKDGFLVGSALWYWGGPGLTLDWQLWNQAPGPDIWGSRSVKNALRDRESLAVIRQLTGTSGRQVQFRIRCSGSVNQAINLSFSAMFFPKNV
jgi:hypothetical protein